MNSVDNDVKQAKQLIYSKCGTGIKFSEHSSSYLFTTENQQALNMILSYKNKSILTVAGGGDQYLSAIYYGASQVTLFDINRFTKYVLYLKMAAVKMLPYEEFLEFIIPDQGDGSGFLNLDTFNKVVKVLPEDVAYFWKNIIVDLKVKRGGNFFVKDCSFYSADTVKRGIPFYESKTRYNQLQDIVFLLSYPTINFVDALNLSGIGGTYDIVYLSNIIDCYVAAQKPMYSAFTREDDKYEKKIAGEILKEIKPLMHSDSIAMLDYRPNASTRDTDDYLFRTRSFVKTSVPSKIVPYDDPCFEGYDVDLVLTYKRK